jgi:hypothetical protein
MSFSDLPSIGTATGSRVDSAAKHIMACKVDSRALQNWIAQPTTCFEKENHLHTNKNKWCMHKDEIVLNTTKKKDLSDGCVKGYPMVVTTLGDIHPMTMLYIAQLYSQSEVFNFYNMWKIENYNEYQEYRESNQYALSSIATEFRSEDEKITVDMQIKSLPEFRCQGVALGQAWASYLSGDTVASVLVGGMMTVLNGHFPMHTGDEVQWYFDFESCCFNSDNTGRVPNGCRLSPHNNNLERSKKQNHMNQRVFGSNNGIGRSNGLKDVNKIVRVKSYRMKHEEGIYTGDHYGDKSRVFAKCISGGRPFDAVDIMIMTQSS